MTKRILAGVFNYQVDKKGRVSIPKEIRESFNVARGEASEWIAIPVPNSNVIAFIPKTDNTDSEITAFGKLAKCGASGRTVIAENLHEHLKLTGAGTLTFVKMAQGFHVMTDKTWEKLQSQYVDSTQEKVQQALDNVGLGIPSQPSKCPT